MYQALSRRELAQQMASVATLEGEFTLRSGQKSHRYFDKYRFEGNPELLKPLALAMAELIPAETDIIAGLELGGVPLATAISLETRHPRRNRVTDRGNDGFVRPTNCLNQKRSTKFLVNGE